MHHCHTLRMWQVVRDWLLDAVFPNRCCGCGTLGDLLCHRCYNKLELQLKPVMFSHDNTALDSMQVITEFDLLSHRIIVAYKYQSVRDLSRYISECLLNHCTIPACDLVTAVPMHMQKQLERGYNQSELLAQHIAQALSVPYQSVLGKRTKGQVQAKLNYSMRWKQVAGLFAVSTPPDAIRGKSILLIDDVMTTGATLQACAQELKNHGAQTVHAICFTHGK